MFRNPLSPVLVNPAPRVYAAAVFDCARLAAEQCHHRVAAQVSVGERRTDSGRQFHGAFEHWKRRPDTLAPCEQKTQPVRFCATGGCHLHAG
jgi:hypothetical protein